MAVSDFPDWQKGVFLFAGSVPLMMAADFPDWTDGVNVVTAPPAPPGDVPDWTKTAQEVPGISPTPPVTTYFAWYDAAQITGVTDGAALATWPDLSGNGYDLTQSTGAKQPTFYKTTTSKLVGGRPAVWFDHSVKSMANSSFPSHATFTAFSVYIGTALTTGQDAVWYDSQPSATALYMRSTGYSFQDAAGLATIVTPPSPTVASVVATWADGANIHVTLNGGSPVTAAALGGVGPQLTVGTFNDQTLGPFEGPICSLIYYPAVLSNADIASITAYLIARWTS